MSVETEARSRRAVLLGAIGAVAASLGTALGRPAPVRAGVDGDVVLGSTNVSTEPTTISMSDDTGAAIAGVASALNAVGVAGYATTGVIGNGSVLGVHGESSGGIGVQGLSGAGLGTQGRSTNTGVRGESTHPEATGDFTVESHRSGVIGVAGGGEEILPVNTDETGVYGLCDLSPNSTGVWGDSGQGFGVFGTGDVGAAGIGFIGLQGIPTGFGSMGVFAWGGLGETGIYGYAGAAAPPAPLRDVAIQARAGSTSQVALNVNGRVQFSRSGKVTVAAGTKSKTVTMAGVTTASYIIATPQTNRTGVFVQSVVPGTGSFKINLNKTVAGNTIIGFLVIN